MKTSANSSISLVNQSTPIIISVKEARRIIGNTNTKYTYTQIEEIINTLLFISDTAIDSYIEMKVNKKAHQNLTIIKKDI